MSKHQFIFKIDGEIDGKKLSPETVKLRDLLGVLQDLEHAVLATAKSLGASDSDDLGFSLTGVHDGSDKITLSASRAMYAAAGTVSQAIASGDFGKIPIVAQRDLRSIWKRAKNKNWTYSISSPSNGMVESTIRADQELLSPTVISGDTSLWAKIDRAGGENDPTAQLVLIDGDRITASVRDRQLAKRLGEMLFDVVSLEGEAVWDVESWQLKNFTITGITEEFEDTRPSDAFKALAEVAGNHWDNIDPLEYVRDLRSE